MNSAHKVRVTYIEVGVFGEATRRFTKVDGKGRGIPASWGKSISDQGLQWQMFNGSFRHLLNPYPPIGSRLDSGPDKGCSGGSSYGSKFWPSNRM